MRKGNIYCICCHPDDVFSRTFLHILARQVQVNVYQFAHLIYIYLYLIGQQVKRDLQIITFCFYLYFTQHPYLFEFVVVSHWMPLPNELVNSSKIIFPPHNTLVYLHMLGVLVETEIPHLCNSNHKERGLFSPTGYIPTMSDDDTEIYQPLQHRVLLSK